MLIGFMVSRLRRACVLLLFTAGATSIACQKVPLLAPTGSNISLTPNATALPLGGTTDIIAQVIEAAGTPPHSGTQVTFSTTLGTIQPAQAETDISGRVVVKFLAGNTSGTATITALSGGVTVAAANTVKILIGAAAVGSVSVSASPATLPSSGGTATITATVADNSGNLLPSVPVTFAIDTSTTGTAGGSGTLSQTVVNTDVNGKAQTALTTNRTTTVSATAGVATTSGTTTTAAQVGRATVTVNTTATITLGAQTPNPGIAGQTVTLPVTPGTSTTASPIVRATVDWGDGRTNSFTGLPTTISHTYTGPGSYLVLLTGVDAFGDVSTTSASVLVNPRPALVVSVTLTTANPTPGTTTAFAITATPTTGNAITSIAVDFGDGVSGTLPGNATVVQHIYAAAGTYPVTVIATDSSGATGSAATVIVVSNPVTARFTFTPNPGVVAQPVTFDASSSSSGSGIASYSWTFGDTVNNSASGVTVQHTYAAAGTYNVVLTVVDNGGKTASVSQQVVVH
jgi:PKD repeat protein